jgi:phosphatidylserine decarboxylase
MIVQAKGVDYSLENLLASSDHHVFEKGSFITIYLSPRDYHRVHCPATCVLTRATYIPGRLFSVNEATTRAVKDLFADNERLVMDFTTDSGKKMCVIMVGAMIVAAIKPAWREHPYQARLPFEESFSPAKPFDIGDELGLFQMGSTAIVLFEESIEWLKCKKDPIRMGEAMVE